MPRIEIVVGNIVHEKVDAIVNAANSSLQGGGGVDGAIHRAAGSELAAAGRKLAPCPTGEAKATPAFNLPPPIKHVIHTVGPVWNGGASGEDEQLASCYRRCLEVADDLRATSIAFPAISTGVYGYPPELAAEVVATTLRNTRTQVGLVRLVAFNEEAGKVLTAALASYIE